MLPNTPLTLRTLPALLAVLVVLPGAAAGQAIPPPVPVWRPGQVTVAALGGGAAFSDFLTVDLSASLDERLTARTTVTAAVALGYWPAREWGIRLHAGWAPTRFEWERPRDAERTSLEADARGADLHVWMADLDVLIRLPLGLGRVEPYGIVGGGVVRYVVPDTTGVPPEAAEDFEGGRLDRAALVLGAGALVPMQRDNLLLTFELTDHVVRSPVGASTGAEGITSNVRLLVGLTLPIAWRGR